MCGRDFCKSILSVGESVSSGDDVLSHEYLDDSLAHESYRQDGCCIKAEKSFGQPVYREAACECYEHACNSADAWRDAKDHCREHGKHDVWSQAVIVAQEQLADKVKILRFEGGFNYSAVQSIVNVLVEERKRADPGVFLEVEVDLSKYAGLNLKFINGKDEQ